MHLGKIGTGVLCVYMCIETHTFSLSLSFSCFITLAQRKIQNAISQASLYERNGLSLVTYTCIIYIYMIHIVTPYRMSDLHIYMHMYVMAAPSY